MKPPVYVSTGLGPLENRASALAALFAPHMSAIGGKADMTFCTAHVRFGPKADMPFRTAHVR